MPLFYFLILSASEDPPGLHPAKQFLSNLVLNQGARFPALKYRRMPSILVKGGMGVCALPLHTEIPVQILKAPSDPHQNILCDAEHPPSYGSWCGPMYGTADPLADRPMVSGEHQYVQDGDCENTHGTVSTAWNGNAVP